MTNSTFKKILMESLNRDDNYYHNLPENKMKRSQDYDYYKEHIGDEAVKKYGNGDEYKNHLNDEDYMNRKLALLHPNATKEELHKALDDDNMGIRAEVISHPNSDYSHAARTMQDRNPYIRENIVKSALFVRKAYNRGNWEHLERAYNNHKYYEDDYE